MKKFMTIQDKVSNNGITRQIDPNFIKEKKIIAAKSEEPYSISTVEYTKFMKSDFVAGKNNAQMPVTSYIQAETDSSGIEKDTRFLRPLEINHSDEFNYFVYGDNETALKLLMPRIRNRVDLIYIDPPFGTGQIFSDIDKNHAYDDVLVKNEFLEFLKTRLLLLRECLSPRGSIYLHIDKKIGHYVKVLMDEIFGYENYINDITRIKCNPKNFSRKAYGNISDMILFYAKKRDSNIWNEVKEPLSDSEISRFYSKKHKTKGRYTTHPLHAPGETLNGDTGMKWKGLSPPKGRHWRYSRNVLDELDRKGLIEWSATGNPRKIVFANGHNGKKIQDIWEFKDRGMSYIDYPTQKNENLLETIVLNSSNENSLVLDCFAGSGTTILAADKFKRRWIGMDNSLQAYTVLKKNLAKLNIKCNFYKTSANGNNS